MRPDKVFVIARREYAIRIRSKAFWLSTVALPVLLLVLMIVPTLLASRAGSSKRLVVVDETGRLGASIVQALADADDGAAQVASFEVFLEPPAADPAGQRADLDRRILAGEIDAWLRIAESDLEEGRIEYHSESVASFLSQTILEQRLTETVRRDRLSRLGIAPDLADGLIAAISLRTVKVTAEGSREEAEGAGFFLAYALFFLLYLVLMIYGQQVMNGVLEEKTSRIVEVIVSTTRPFDLMMGKLCGICAIALTQLSIWLGTVAVLTLPAIVASVAWLPAEVDVPRLEPRLIAHFLVLFLIGFFVYSTFYAAIGAAFNNVQEAQQFAGYAVVLLIAPMLFFFLVIDDPDSTLSVVTSLVPPFTPLIMLLRLAVKAPPAWQVALGYAAATGFAVFMVWLAGRIYRVGILIYGKKPTLKELWRWLRYA
ncbi:MAG: ABC transporter permease [Acidobacteriota bacterium]|nr:ABC transporter permease [Acidobacteriota bacterium]MDH3524992.1 ABC transporter permease [Acidobacteriota bacterium]